MPREKLAATSKAIGQCAKAVASKAPKPPTPAHTELQVGIGTCGDWVAWAAQLRRLDFASHVKRGSRRSKNYLEATRFTYAWTAANALFSRDSILDRVAAAPHSTSEFRRFRTIYNAAALPAADEKAYLQPLHTTLALVRKPDSFPWAALTTVRIIDLIYYKYTPDSHKSRGESAKAVESVALNNSPVTSIGLPMILYATRNWTVHGALLDSSFRGAPQQFHLYITTITRALADVLERFADVVRSGL